MSDERPGPQGWFLEVGGRRLGLPPGELLVGRGADCDVVLPDGTVSRHHAVLVVEEERVVLRDLASSNGSFAKGEALTGEAELHDGDRLRLGRVHAVLGRGPAVLTGRLFCRTCGHRVDADAETCPTCGEDLRREPPLSRSEAVAMSEVMPVGEVLATPARGAASSPYPLGWDEPEGRSPEESDDTTGYRSLAPEEVSAAVAAAASAETMAEAPDLPAAAPPGPAPAGAGAEDAAVEGAEADLVADPTALRGLPRFLPAATFLPRLGAALLDAGWVVAAGLAGALVAGGFEAGEIPWAGLATALVAWGVVSVLGWTRWGTTPGKVPFHLYVCDLDGRPGLPAGRAVLRWLGQLLSLATLGIGFLRGGLGADHRALHDRLAGTYVARDGERGEGR